VPVEEVAVDVSAARVEEVVAVDVSAARVEEVVDCWKDFTQ